MPVDFLTAAQERRYGCYPGEPTAAQLARYFHLDDADRERIAVRRGDHNRLGFALQLGTVRFLGTFLPDPTEVPAGVVAYLATQLGHPDPGCLIRYREGESRWDHTREIRQHYGYRDFSEQPEHFRLVRWLYLRAWLTAERPSILFDLTTARLVERKVLLPGVTVLTRLIASVRDRAATRLWRLLAAAPSAAQRTRLEHLLVPAGGGRQTPLDRLRKAPTRMSAPALVAALQQLEEVRALEVARLDLASIPPIRIMTLARYAMAARAQTIARMPPERRLATLLALARVLAGTALDDTLDLFDLLIGVLLARVERVGQKQRLRTLGDLDAAALQLREACLVVLGADPGDRELRAAIFARISSEQLAAAAETVGELTRLPEDHNYEALPGRYPQVRRFLPLLLRTVEFAATAAGREVLAGWQFLQKIEGCKRPVLDDAPLAGMSRPWKRLVLGEPEPVNRCFYTFCLLERLRDGLRRRDLFVTGSGRWGDPRAKLLQGAAWEERRTQVCHMLGRAIRPEAELQQLEEQLTLAYERTAASLPTNAAVRIQTVADRDTVVLTGLDKLAEPESLLTLRDQVADLMPRVDLPEVLLEVHTWTGFAAEFTHISEGQARVEELSLSLCAVLLAEACNIGLEPLIQPDVPALTRGRLAWVQQNYLRAETLTRANARLVDYQATLPLAQAWGGGEVASADGLRFVVPVRTLNAGPNPKYFGVGRGVTYYNFTSDQFTGFHGIVIPGTLRDSLFILDGLLEQQTQLQPTEVMSDTAGYSDVVFGLFWLLGYQFSPRLADIGEARFWRLDPAADYGALNNLARHPVNTGLIARNWDDLLRVAGSLKLGTVSASELMRTLQGGSRPATLARALGELGRVAKTLYLLAYLDDERYRRRILTQLNRGEGRHRLARAVFHGQRGELRQRYREGQEDQLDALGLVVNVLVLWNTRYLAAALAQLRAQGATVKPEDVERLSPLGHTHINLLGRYHFAVSEPVQRGELRPLRVAHEWAE